MKADFREILCDSSRQVIDIGVSYLESHQEIFDELLELVFSDKDIFSNRASRVVEIHSEKNSSLIKPYLEEIINRLPSFTNEGVRRNLLKIFTREYKEILSNEDLTGKLVDSCFNFLNSKKEPPSVRCYSIHILYGISKSIPEIKNELYLSIEDMIEESSSGLKNVGKKHMSKLAKEMA